LTCYLNNTKLDIESRANLLLWEKRKMKKELKSFRKRKKPVKRDIVRSISKERLVLMEKNEIISWQGYKEFSVQEFENL